MKRTFNVGGLTVHTYETPRSGITPKSVGIFLLHGRQGSAEGIEWVAEALIRNFSAKEEEAGTDRAPIVITFDQRNHGNRLVTAKANNGWNETSDARDKNDHHALDMYSIQTGTASDVSFLIDFLPSYLYPMDEKDIACWVVAGVSLGGHASWIALKNDKRISAGIPIIGCPDYLALMSDRAAKSSVPFAPPYVPKSLLQLIHKKDPAYSPYTIADETNPYFGKKVLVLCGGKDKLVPWTFSQEFVEKLEVGTNGKKKAVVYPECGHECTQEMVDTMATFIWEEVVIQ